MEIENLLPNSKIYCMYHASDFDGKCSAAIINKYFIEKTGRTVENIPVVHVKPINITDITENDIVFIVDICLPFPQMEALKKQCLKLIWIDHHAGVIDKAKEYGLSVDGLLKASGVAACELVWEYLYNSKKPPKAIKMIGQYDIWNHKFNPDVIPFQYGLGWFRREETNPEGRLWNVLIGNKKENMDTYNDILAKGLVIQKYAEEEFRSYARVFATDFEFEGYKCIGINRGLCGSKIFEGFFNPALHDFMVIYSVNKDGWSVSLYAGEHPNPNINLAHIAQKYGGNGHPGAAGFHCSELPFKIIGT